MRSSKNLSTKSLQSSESYIGVISCQDYEEPRLERLKIFRGLRERHFEKKKDELRFVDPLLVNLKNKMLTAIAQVNKWKRAIISQHDADELAKLEYMTQSERELWIKFFETLAQKKYLEEFLLILKKSKESDKEAKCAFEQVASSVKNQIADLDTFLSSMNKPIEDIRRRLEEPDYRNNILLVIHQILQANTHASKMLNRASQ